jgi:5,10-methylene-tetrahydrofolate dehydrogenase/methenyl tetrahydrofolate cyclohydrolase
MILINGKEVAEQIKQEIKSEVETIVSAGNVRLVWPLLLLGMTERVKPMWRTK